jgi:DnaJ-class molecular chaperone
LLKNLEKKRKRRVFMPRNGIKKCHECRGSGQKIDKDICGRCHGTGQVVIDNLGNLFCKCPDCKGAGIISYKFGKCEKCNGSGYLKKKIKKRRRHKR